MRTSANGNVYRRLSDTRVHDIRADDLAQPFDVDIAAEPYSREPAAGLVRYYKLGVDAAVDEIHRAHDLGIPTAIVRLIEGSANTPSERVKQYIDTFCDLRNNLGGDRPDLVIDPFSIALNPDWTWGVQDDNDVLLREETEGLIYDIAEGFGSAGADGLITLGRVEAEVELTRSALDDVAADTTIYSFSQNSETSTAYIYLGPSVRMDTGQKCLVGNTTEMTFRALADVWDGTDMCVVKPLQSYHLMRELRLLLSSENARSAFLETTAVQQLAEQSPYLTDKLEMIRADNSRMRERCERVSIGGYTISGTSYELSLLDEAKGNTMARDRLEETWLNVLASVADRKGPIVDRNAVAFFAAERFC